MLHCLLKIFEVLCCWTNQVPAGEWYCEWGSICAATVDFLCFIVPVVLVVRLHAGRCATFHVENMEMIDHHHLDANPLILFIICDMNVNSKRSLEFLEENEKVGQDLAKSLEP